MDRLFEDFPNIFKRRPAENWCFGADVADGWADIVYNLSKKLSAIAPEGAAVRQIKEKFGELRFYMDCATPEMYKLIAEAEREAGRTCRVCGNRGWWQGEGWSSAVLCAEHGIDPPTKLLADSVGEGADA